ncbi:lysophospholipid acyltransferase [Coccidioides posadasii str. Silveira]|uniref:MBOAT family protein n=1 Tax=Coccidioides posadasii (strain C735) TaxID=222929 RepID=C5P292_COCP7|nr:MBOAT family protein [Coccidioides posadasii C735 delta SOWgp]EER28995.1 MBOAT family protein [Coccidioides posadasii C735 delta SOWgp]QVM06022.1 lysophospholipid acyltransferase [Coccidioides posadasii str. Silveira]|eukprot:XP_003071140.1 MBOAT family protein [Coccidioides posadasii C735 delta SOWgp]
MLPYIDTPFIPLSELTGASIDELKLVTSFLLSYPLAAILKRLPDSQPWQKNAFIVLVSIFYLVGLFDLWDGLRTLLYNAVGAYAIAYYIDGSLMPWIGFLFLMGYMSISHIYRQIVAEPSAVDITGAQMVLVMKLSAFCWNVHDGRLPENMLSEGQKHAAIRRMPSVLDFAGYVLFFPSLFAGPAFDYVEYKRWIETTMFDHPPGVDPSKVPPTRKKRKIPRSGRPAMWKMLQGLLWILLFIQFGPSYGKSRVLSQDYLECGFVKRVFILHMLGLTARFKYYGVWALTEGACILCGMGYNGFDPQTGKTHWNKLENVNPWGLETAQNPHAYLGNWNKNTNHWLRNYVYLRVTPRGKKPGFRASLATFLTSAMWHGFYAGYYLTFVLGAFLQTTAKNFRRHLRPFFLTTDGSKPTPLKRYYDILGWLTTQLALSFAAAPFIILQFTDCITAWKHVYFYGIIGIASSLAFFASPGKKFLVKKLDARNKGLAAGRRDEKKEPAQPPTLGLPDDPEREFDEAVSEIRSEIEAKRRRGSVVSMPSGHELKVLIEERLGRKKR